MDKRLENHLVIIIGFEHYNPLGMVRTLGRLGVDPIFIGIKYKANVASSSKYVKTSYLVENDDEALEILLKNYGDVAEKTGYKPILLFSEDSTLELFENIHDQMKDKFIFFNAGGKGNVKKYLDKFKILDCAKLHGLSVLNAEVVKLGEMPKNPEYPVITKAISPNSGGWKGDVNICYNEEELKEAFKRIKSPLVLVQKYIDKKTEMTLEGYCINHGKDMVIGDQCFYPYAVKGYYSPWHTNQPFKDDALKAKLDAMFEEIGFEGVFEIEFLIDKDDNKYFSEINFRNSTWSYSATVAGNPIVYQWCLAMITGEIIPAKEFEPFMSMVEPIDYMLRVDKGRCSLPEWLKDFREVKCTYYYASDDMEPWKVLCENWEKLK